MDDLELDDDAHDVRRGGNRIELSPTEFNLLRYLMPNPNRVLAKTQILNSVWEYDFNPDASIVDSDISYLRRKVDSDPHAPVIIQTKRASAISSGRRQALSAACGGEGTGVFCASEQDPEAKG
jgi:two-component system OmpR family response regulator